MSRKLLLTLAAIALLIAAAALLLPRLVDRDALLDRATTLIYEKSGATLEVNGDLDFSVFPQLALGRALAGAA